MLTSYLLAESVDPIVVQILRSQSSSLLIVLASFPRVMSDSNFKITLFNYTLGLMRILNQTCYSSLTDDLPIFNQLFSLHFGFSERKLLSYAEKR